MNIQNLEKAFRKELGNSFCIFNEIDSTNSYIKREACNLSDGYVVCALSQSTGRGRFGKSFVSPPGGIYFSMLLRPRFSVELCSELTALAAVAVCCAIEEVCNVSPSIKWVNDIILGDKKICGILSELVFSSSGGVDFVVIGVGINANVRADCFEGELKQIASSIFEQTGIISDAAALAAETAKRLRDLIADFPGNRDSILAAYRARCATVGRQVCIHEGEKVFQACAEAIDDNFHLVIRDDNGERRALLGGDVSVRGLCGYI